MTLVWDAPTTATGLSGYKLYYGTASRTYNQPAGGGISTGSTTAYTLNNLTSGQTYFVAVTAVDAEGRESAYSNEVSKTLP
jgi:fibronectin type 3 domain-containing protein